MTGITEPSGSPFSDQSFVYDPGYNRSSWTQASTTENYTVNNLDQYTAITGESTPSWNSDGGLATYAGSSYSYDALHRLTEVDTAGNKCYFSYDPTGRRVKKVIKDASGATTLATYNYHYDGSEVAVEYRPSSVTWTYYLGVGADEPVLRVSGTTKQWYYRDGEGSISAVADNSGNVNEATNAGEMPAEQVKRIQVQLLGTQGHIEVGYFPLFIRTLQHNVPPPRCAVLVNREAVGLFYPGLIPRNKSEARLILALSTEFYPRDFRNTNRIFCLRLSFWRTLTLAT